MSEQSNPLYTGGVRVTYNGDRATTEFPVPFPVENKEALRVLIVSSGAVTEPLRSTWNFSSGNVTLLTGAPDIGVRIVVMRDTPIARRGAYTSGGSLTAASLNGDLDRLTQIAQDLDARTTLFPEIAIDAGSAAGSAACHAVFSSGGTMTSVTVQSGATVSGGLDVSGGANIDDHLNVDGEVNATLLTVQAGATVSHTLLVEGYAAAAIVSGDIVLSAYSRDVDGGYQRATDGKLTVSNDGGLVFSGRVFATSKTGGGGIDIVENTSTVIRAASGALFVSGAKVATEPWVMEQIAASGGSVDPDEVRQIASAVFGSGGTINGKLTISGGAISGGLTVSGAVGVSGSARIQKLFVTSNAEISGFLTARGNADIMGGVNIRDYAIVSGYLIASDTVNLSKGVVVKGSLVADALSGGQMRLAVGSGGTPDMIISAGSSVSQDDWEWPKDCILVRHNGDDGKYTYMLAGRSAISLVAGRGGAEAWGGYLNADVDGGVTIEYTDHQSGGADDHHEASVKLFASGGKLFVSGYYADETTNYSGYHYSGHPLLDNISPICQDTSFSTTVGGYTVALTSGGGLVVSGSGASVVLSGGQIEMRNLGGCSVVADSGGNLVLNGGDVLGINADHVLIGGNMTVELAADNVSVNSRPVLTELATSTDTETTSANFPVLSGGTSYIYTQPLTALTFDSITSDCRAEFDFTAASGAQIGLPSGGGVKLAGSSSLDSGTHYWVAVNGARVVVVPYIIIGE